MRTRRNVFRLRIFHFNDAHGRLADLDAEPARPVFSRIARHVATARADCAERSDEAALLFSGGDDLVGSPFAELAGARPGDFRCHAAYRLYSAAGVDACAVGNHDLDWGLGMLSLAATRDATFPLLAANLKPAAQDAGSRIQPFVVLPVKGARVGVIGLTTPAEIKPLFPGEFEIIDPLAALLAVLPQVQAASHLIIVLSHLGHRAKDKGALTGSVGDVELARALPRGAVTAIIGAHTHSALNKQGIDPANVVNGVLLAQAGGFGRWLGEVTIEVSAEGARPVGARLWPVDALPPDEAFEQARVLPLARDVQKLLSEPLGCVEGFIDAKASFGAAESAPANYAADALAASCRAAGLPVDFAMVDASTVCDGLPESGPLTRGHLFRLSPYADSIVLLRLPPDRLRALMQDNAQRVDLPGERQYQRGFMQFSREIRYRIRMPRSRRAPLRWTPRLLRTRRRIRATKVTVNGQPLLAFAGRVEPLLIAYSSFMRQFAHHWQQEARRQGLRLFEIDSFPTQVTQLGVREALVEYARETGGATATGGHRRDGRLTID